MKWSGCNYYINQGNNEYEPIGTAQSMHDCNACELDGNCPLQKDTETWEYTPEHGKLADEWVGERRRLGFRL